MDFKSIVICLIIIKVLMALRVSMDLLGVPMVEFFPVEAVKQFNQIVLLLFRVFILLFFYELYKNPKLLFGDSEQQNGG